MTYGNLRFYSGKKANMKKDFNINYPMIHQGTEKTEVVFFQKESELFANIGNGENKHIYVTDSNIAFVIFAVAMKKDM